MKKTWKETAWNGICFRAPAHWEIGRIGLRYLLLETLDGPQLEIKWAPVKGKFSLEKQLKQLAGMQHRQVRKSFQVCHLPEQWNAVLRRFTATGFIWRGTELNGRGLLLFCPQCRTATLIQFYLRANERLDPAAAFLLESFKDHGHTRLSVFDIQAELPQGFSLKSYRFNPGEFELSFANDRHTVILYRWSPAAVLLHNQTLTEFADSRINLNACEFLNSDETTVEGGVRRTPSVGRQLWNRLGKSPNFRWTRLWHEKGKNRLLAVDMSGRDGIDKHMFAQLCTTYESL